MTSATQKSKLSLTQYQHPDRQVRPEEALSQTLAVMLLVDVLGCTRHAADEMPPELLEHIRDCEECLAVSGMGASGSRLCKQRPDRVNSHPSLTTPPEGDLIDDELARVLCDFHWNAPSVGSQPKMTGQRSCPDSLCS